MFKLDYTRANESYLKSLTSGLAGGKETCPYSECPALQQVHTLMLEALRPSVYNY